MVHDRSSSKRPAWPRPTPQLPIPPYGDEPMTRLITLFTGQWADLPLDDMARKASEFGYDGLELACWGDHFEVDKALADRTTSATSESCSNATICNVTRSAPTWSARRFAIPSTSDIGAFCLPTSGATATRPA